jgi:hypothetical protein
MAAEDNINKDHEKEENLRALEEKVKGKLFSLNQILTFR